MLLITADDATKYPSADLIFPSARISVSEKIFPANINPVLERLPVVFTSWAVNVLARVTLFPDKSVNVDALVNDVTPRVVAPDTVSAPPMVAAPVVPSTVPLM